MTRHIGMSLQSKFVQTCKFFEVGVLIFRFLGSLSLPNHRGQSKEGN